MSNRSALSRTVGQNALPKIGRFWFSFFLFGLLTFTTAYRPEDRNADFSPVQKRRLTHFIDISDIENLETNSDGSSSDCKEKKTGPLDCRDPEIYHSMMRAAIEKFRDIHVNRFGKPVPGPNDTTCDMAWRYRPIAGGSITFNKDYRSFVMARYDDCSYRVASIGDYHSGVNARKVKKKTLGEKQEQGSSAFSVVDETAADGLVSENNFRRKRYLIYSGGGDRCKDMKQYLYSLLCALGEAKFLNRTLVMDLSLCLSSIYTSLQQDEEGKDFRYYFDFQHLRESASVLDQTQFWMEWDKWEHRNGFSVQVVEDYRVIPTKLASMKERLIMRKFGLVEPDNYWYRVCQGTKVIKLPWNLLRKSKRLLAIAAAIALKMNQDYDAVYIANEKDNVLSVLQNKIERGRNVYIATTNEKDPSFYEGLRSGGYQIHFLEEYKDLWEPNTEWYGDMMKLTRGATVEFDGYMRVLVNREIFERGKIKIEIT